MNRYLKEQKKQHQEAREGLTQEQVQSLDTKDAEEKLIQLLARTWHIARFSEEYDFMYDSSMDASDRHNGINPMREEYIAQISEKRTQLGVSQLSGSGMALTDETMQSCQQEARDEIDNVRTRIDEILFYKWDPIRVSNSNWPRDEYTSYVADIMQLTLETKSYLRLADHLTYLSTEIMGLTENEERDAAVAQLIFSIVHDQNHYPDHTVVEVD